MWCENSLEESRRLSKKFKNTVQYTVLCCSAHTKEHRERRVLQTEGKRGKNTIPGKDK